MANNTDLEVTEERDSESILQAVEAFPYLANWQTNFDELNRLFAEKTIPKAALARAVILWEMFPLYSSTIARDIDTTGPTEGRLKKENSGIASGLCHFEGMLFQTHELAVELLMRLAERKRIDSGPIEASGRYCRELCRRGDTFNPYCSTWPDCLEEKLFSIPSDIRSAIVTGNASVKRIIASIGTRREVLTPSMVGDSKESPKVVKPRKIAITPRDEEIVELHKQGIKPKEIARLMTRKGSPIRPNAVSKVIFRKS